MNPETDWPVLGWLGGVAFGIVAALVAGLLPGQLAPYMLAGGLIVMWVAMGIAYARLIRK